MIIQQLEKDADRIVGVLPPPMYDVKRVKWIIELALDGSLVGFVPTAGDAGSSDRGKHMVVPYVKRTSGVKPLLLADTPAYVLGLDAGDARAASKHKEFVELTRTCAEATGSASVAAVARFLDSARTVSPPELSRSDLITFRVDGEFPIDEADVQRFWAEHANQEGALRAAPETTCLACGRRALIPPMTPVPVKGIPAGQSSGTALVGANLDVFESYGLQRGATCGVCQSCGERFGKALNNLLERDDTHLRVGPTVFVFWTKEEAGFDFATALSKPDPDAVRLLLASYCSGRSTALSDEDAGAFYATALTASGGRAVVRDWLATTVGDAKLRLAGWFRLIRQVDPWGAEAEPLGLFRLAAAPYRDAKDMSPHVPAVLAQAALHGRRPLPYSLLSVVVARCKSGPGRVGGRKVEVITHAQAALMKAVLASLAPEREDYMSELDTTDRSAAYLCGRLLATVEAIQRSAIPGINATVVDKFFASASTAPASVFGKLLSDAQPHLSKLRKTNEGAHYALQARLEEVLAPLGEFPTTLSLQDQALFSLGYYHQRAADRAARTANRNAPAEIAAEETED